MCQVLGTGAAAENRHMQIPGFMEPSTPEVVQS